MKLMNVGDKVFYIFYENLIVEATIEELENIYTDNEKNTIWNYQYLNGSTKSFLQENNKFQEIEYLEDKELVNQFFWIDEPVGHSIQLGTHDRCFLTLEEALKYVLPSKKKHLKRRLKSARKNVANFILSTWKDIKHPGFEKYKNKKVYVKKK